MNSVHVNELNFNNKVSINFDGGDLSSDSGLLAYRSFDEKIGFTTLLKEKFEQDGVDESHLTYQRSNAILQNVYKCIAGYPTDAASNHLKSDPVFKKVLDTPNLASQPTISRRNNELDKNTFKIMEDINKELLSRAYEIEEPEHIIFDIDSTHIDTYGKQHGTAYNSHYGTIGFHPLMVFDGITGDLIKVELRSGNVYTSRNTTRFMGDILTHYRKNYKDTYLIIRGDSGFALPELYELAEEHNTTYAIRLKANSTLSKLSEELKKDFYFLYGTKFEKTCTLYGEFMYQAKSWNKPRRVVCKIQREAGNLVPNSTFVVTTMDATPKEVIHFYSKRGTMENFIKEAKIDFGMETLSHTSYMANANRLMQMVLAYNLNNLMRRLCFSTEDQPKRMQTLRIVLTKVAGRFTTSGRYSVFKLCSSYPFKAFFIGLFKRIESLPYFR